jgi:segregation and condensation protein B
MNELSEQLGYDEEEITEAMTNLQTTVKRRRGGGLQVVEIGGKWAMEVKPIIANHLPKETKSELAPKLLKAAALIAYHQPMPQSRLVELLGQRAYDHIRELAQAGLIGRRRDGNTRRLTTTRRFSEMFGCPHTDRKKVKAWFRDMVVSSGMLDGMESKLALRDETDSAGGTQTILELGEDE